MFLTTIFNTLLNLYSYTGNENIFMRKNNCSLTWIDPRLTVYQSDDYFTWKYYTLLTINLHNTVVYSCTYTKR